VNIEFQRKGVPMSDGDVKLNKAVELLNQRGLNGLIIFSGGTCNIVRPSYLHYFSELKPMGPRNAAIVSQSGGLTLLVEPPWDSIRASRHSWIGDVRGTAEFITDLVDIMRQLKMAGSVGVVGSREMTHDVYAGIEKEAKIVFADDIVEEMAREKTERELQIVRKTADIADVGFEAFLEHARVGVREYELVAEMEYAMRSSGADDIFILVSSGKHNYEMHEPTDKRLQEGDIVIGEITPVSEGQFIQLCRTVILGKPSPVVVEKYNMLLHAFEDALKQVKAGVPASSISRAMNKVIREAGYGKYCYPPYMRARGHGFGVGSIAPGAVIDDDTKVTLEKQQVIVVHPNQYLPETGYLACGEAVLVTETGMERLSRTETRLYEREG
jgi:Xaa-Pro dipeptidase